MRLGGGGASMGVMLEFMVVCGAVAGTWTPTGRWGLLLSDMDLPWPFISILIMLEAVVARLGVQSPERNIL